MGIKKDFIVKNGLQVGEDVVVTGDITANNIVGSITGQISDISNFTTDDLSEGSNLYFTQERVRNSFTATGGINYNSSTGEFTADIPEGYDSSDFNVDFAAKSTTDLSEGSNLYFTTARIDSHLSGGTGVTYSNGAISIGQNVATSANPTFNNLTLTGNLTVQGSQTILETSTLQVEDQNIELGKVSSPSNITADTGGLTILAGGDGDKTWKWLSATDSWTSSEHVNIVSGKDYRIAGNTVLTNNTLGSGVVNSSLTGVGVLNTGSISSGFGNINIGSSIFTGNGSGLTNVAADTASTLQTARNFTIGNTTRSFNGTTNVSWSLSDIGVNNATLTLATSGIATGSQTWSSNQGTNATFTVNVPATNLTYSTAATTGTVNSSTGTNATIPAATTSLAGLMTNADKTKLDGIAAGAQVNVGTNLGQGGSGNSRTITSSTGSNVTVSTATTSNAGFMSTGDKSKLNGIAAGAQVNVATNLSWTNGTTAGPRVNSSTGSNAVMPTASATISGAVTTGNQTWAGTKTFSAAVVLSTAGTATTHAVRADRNIAAGTGLTGGGNLTANRTFNIDIASQAEAEAGTNNTKVMTPLRLRNALNATGTAPVFACRAWVNFSGTNGAIRASGNVSSVTRSGTGRYVVNFTTAMQDINYAPVFSADNNAGDNVIGICGLFRNNTMSTTSLPVNVNNASDNARDGLRVIVSVFR